MTLKNLLGKKQDAILQNWLNQILESYPHDGAKFLKHEKDRFKNPVGHTLANETRLIYGQLLHGLEHESVSRSLENIIKIRNVQDYSSSQATVFVYLLKKAIRDEIKNDIDDQQILQELLQFEAQIDQLALLAFDIYTQCREGLYETRINEIKRQSIHFLRHFEDQKKKNTSTGENH
jgi:hypothetical protein